MMFDKLDKFDVIFAAILAFLFAGNFAAWTFLLLFNLVLMFIINNIVEL